MSELTTRDLAKRAREAGFILAALPESIRNKALLDAADALEARAEEIFAKNKWDMGNAEEDCLAAPLLKRLKFDESKLRDVCAGLRDLAALDDPIGKVEMKTELAKGMVLTRVACPMGVVGVIFESRPDALVQIAGLCIKSGNAVLLKGGYEAILTNHILFKTMEEAAVKAGLPLGFMGLLTTREEVGEMLSLDEYIDLIIPRGSNSFVRHIMQNSRIPVLGHSDGVCHLYLDADCDAQMAAKIAVDAKTQYVAACNTIETLLVHKDAAQHALPVVAAALHVAGVKLRADARAQALMPGIPCEAADDSDWTKEYSDKILAVKVVDTLEEAIAHINHYGSHHTDAIVTNDDAAAGKFAALVDSAGVYRNCSTRFADGYRYGFGAEVGIATGKLHARGPMGLEGLCSYKYLLSGSGDIVADFAQGRRSFTHRKLK